MHIRIAKLGDAPKIVEISYNDGYGMPLELESVVEYMKHGDTYFLAENDEEPMGVAKLALNDKNEPELFVISVKLKFQRAGVGNKLLQATEKAARKLGDILVLHVRIENAKALAFYRKHGFAIVGEVKDLYEKGDQHYKMRKAL